MATTGQKRSYPDESESSDIDEDALLAEDGEDVGTADITEELNMQDLQLSDEEDVETSEPGTIKPVERGLNLRAYQAELAETAIRGQNTIIHAATGAGKTRVAFYIVKKHLDAHPSGKVAIMADKTFLVNQHFLALKKIMPEYENKTICMSGQKEKTDQLHLLIEGHNIIILTPALIENTIQRHDANFMSKFTMMVFDECHHTQKKSNYNRLMTRYHVLKSQGKTPLPQILGLTATLGTNKANSVEKAKEHALKVMANLDVAKISTVTENKAEYDKFRKDVQIDKRVLPDTGEHDDVHRCIEECMRRTTDLLCAPLDEISAKHPDDAEINALVAALKKKGSVKTNDPQFITWTSELSTAAASLLGRKPTLARLVNFGASYLKIYSETMGVNDELTGHFAAKALDNKLKSQHLGKYSTSVDSTEVEYSKLAKDLVSNIENIYKTEQSLDGKPVKQLIQLLSDYCNEQKDEARYIVFVSTREISEMLKDLLTSKGFKCASFTGSSATSDAGGTSRTDQDKVVTDFKEGKIHGIIATNILEEGFDIPDCDFVLNYNYIGNEISTRQAAGRIRKQQGKRIVLSKRKDTLRESLNIQRGALMDEAMKYILAMPEDDIVNKIRTEQSRIVQMELSKHRNVAKVPKLESSIYKLICKRCGKFEVNCDALRSINGQHHVVIQPDIWTNISTKPFPKKPPRFSEDIICQERLFGAGGNSCTHELGVVSTFRGVKLPFLSYKFLLIKDTTTSTTKPFTKWSDVPFKIQEINDPDDLTAMQMPQDDITA